MTLSGQPEIPLSISKDIGTRLRAERKRCGMTQGQAAALCGIAKRTQANYEAGASDAPAMYLSKAWTIGFDVPYILTGIRQTVVTGGLEPDESQMVERYRKIPSHDQRAVRLLLKAMLDDVSQ
ncbi:helix-turn-helix domain-containing protein [Pseudomonas guariconensis]|uniref:helix-turn-helix domain-containing protein n=1 Tax=Pseudomonas guariconensis TaxID=1288410 RepID=UPI00366C8EC7